jgi:hypothetical protein
MAFKGRAGGKMKTLMILITFGLLTTALLPVDAVARDGDLGNRVKHASVAFVIAGGISYLCRKHIRLTDGSTPQWGCFLMGTIPTVIGASMFEAMQNDLTDAGGDILMAIVGGAAGSLTSSYIFPKSWFDKKGVDFSIKGGAKAQLAFYW